MRRLFRPGGVWILFDIARLAAVEYPSWELQLAAVLSKVAVAELPMGRLPAPN